MNIVIYGTYSNSLASRWEAQGDSVRFCSPFDFSPESLEECDLVVISASEDNVQEIARAYKQQSKVMILGAKEEASNANDLGKQDSTNYGTFTTRTK